MNIYVEEGGKNWSIKANGTINGYNSKLELRSAKKIVFQDESLDIKSSSFKKLIKTSNKLIFWSLHQLGPP